MALYLQETLNVAPGLQKEFFKRVEAEYLPAARAAGMHPLGFWRVASFKGEPSEIIGLWELDGWDHVARLNKLAHGGGSDSSPLRNWHEITGRWVSKRDALLMRQRAENIDTFRGKAMSTRFCWHETMLIQPNRERDYVLGIEAQLGRSYALQGMQMVGEFQPVFRSGVIVNFWSVAHGFDSIGVMGRQEAEEFLDGAYWMDIAVTLREHWRSVWLMPVPVDLNAA